MKYYQEIRGITVRNSYMQKKTIKTFIIQDRKLLIH